jgi:hypothetical protein
VPIDGSLFSSSSLTSRCCYLASTLALSVVVHSLSMEAHSSNATTLPVEHILGLGKRPAGRTNSLVEGDIPGVLSMGCPRVTSGSTVLPSWATSVEKHAPPDRPAEIEGSSAATSLIMTLAAPHGNTSEDGDPPVAVACTVALVATPTPVTGTPPPPIASSLGWASTMSWGSEAWAAPATLAPQKGATYRRMAHCTWEKIN